MDLIFVFTEDAIKSKQKPTLVPRNGLGLNVEHSDDVVKNSNGKSEKMEWSDNRFIKEIYEKLKEALHKEEFIVICKNKIDLGKLLAGNEDELYTVSGSGSGYKVKDTVKLK